MTASAPRQRNVLDDAIGVVDPEVGRWLAALGDVRDGTNRVLDEIRPDAIDSDPGDGGDTLGTVLYHVALVELDWVYTDILDRESDIPSKLFPYDDRVEDGRLSPVVGQSLAEHRARLDTARSMVVEALAPMSNEEFHRVHVWPRQEVTASWVVYHLIDHEVEHRVRISQIRDALAK